MLCIWDWKWVILAWELPLDIFIPFPTVKTGHNWNSLTLIQADHSHRAPWRTKLQTFYRHLSSWKGWLFNTQKTISTKTKRHHVNNSLSEVVFTLVWLVWHNFLYKDMFTPSSFLLQSLPLRPSCGNECQASNVSYLEARTRQALN